MTAETLSSPLTEAARERDVTPAGARAAAFIALALGVTILFGVGFASPNVVHNAAHDTRHAFGFPCH